jgi:hypothetical protein
MNIPDEQYQNPMDEVTFSITRTVWFWLIVTACLFWACIVYAVRLIYKAVNYLI